MNQREFIDWLRTIDANCSGAPSIEQWSQVRRELGNIQAPAIDQFLFFQLPQSKISAALSPIEGPYGRRVSALLQIGRASVGGAI